ncbi:hypothetical protein [Saccharomonospora xinjiangensis]|uniref:hypothetical protein n=1 Tax=Saccharomonospora xinjiangensis TaxID=75294 RepID=UPI00106F695F|nr:hypothetical protein [Saccharomonospora xinjiangensis]
MVVVDDRTRRGLPIEQFGMGFDDQSADDMDGDPGGADRAPADEPESTFARRAKLIALLLATAALVVSVVVASALADDSGRPADDDSAARRDITGAAALGGFALPGSEDASPGTDSSASSEPGTEASGKSVPKLEAAPGSPSPDGEHDEHGEHDADATSSRATRNHLADESATTATGAGSARSEPLSPELESAPRDVLAAVRDFYDLVGSAPETALARVAPDLVGDEQDILLEAWRSLTSVVVEHVSQEADGSVTVVVTMKPAYGSPLRITQLLGFSDGPQPVINQATLLSIRTL